MGPRRAAGAAGLARRRVPLRGSPDRAVEAAAGGEHVRVRGRARHVGDAEPHHGAGAQTAQPVRAAAAAVGQQVPPLPRLLVVDQGRRARVSSDDVAAVRGTSDSASFWLLSLLFFGFRCLYVPSSSIPPGSEMYFHSSSCIRLRPPAADDIPGHVNEQS